MRSIKPFIMALVALAVSAVAIQACVSGEYREYAFATVADGRRELNRSHLPGWIPAEATATRLRYQAMNVDSRSRSLKVYSKHQIVGRRISERRNVSLSPDLPVFPVRKHFLSAFATLWLTSTEF